MIEENQLAQICRNFGAVPPRDQLMARKLLERAEQLSLKRGIERLEALQYLLSLMVKAREADDPSCSAWEEGSSRSAFSEKLPDQQENR